MSIIPPGLVSGPSLVPQPPLIPPVTAPQPVDSSAGSKTDSNGAGQQGGSSAFLSQGSRDAKLTYSRPASAEPGQGFVTASADSGTAAADAAAINAPAVTEPTKAQAQAAASAAYAMVADAPAGMPPSVLSPLRGT